MVSPPSPLVSGVLLGEPPFQLALRGPSLAWGISVHSALPVLELRALTPWCVLLNGKWSGLETTQTAERGSHAASRADPGATPGHCWREEPPELAGGGGGWAGREAPLPGLSPELGLAARARRMEDWRLPRGQGGNREISAAPSGALSDQPALRPASRNRFLLFLTTCSP